MNTAPLLSPTVAAYLGTGGELLFSSLLALGLIRPLAALGLSALNIVAVISYYHDSRDARRFARPSRMGFVACFAHELTDDMVERRQRPTNLASSFTNRLIRIKTFFTQSHL